MASIQPPVPAPSPPASPPPPTDHDLLRAQRKINSRISLPFAIRLPLASTIAFLTGLGLGVVHGSEVTGLRFRAENAHRLPTTPIGWYLYHKSKNYQTAAGGLKEGGKMGAKVAFWTAGFFGVEEALDRWRGEKDVLNTVGASCAVAGGFSIWNRFPITTAARTAKTGLILGVAYGLVQDALGAARGRIPSYVDYLRGRQRPRPDSTIDIS